MKKELIVHESPKDPVSESIRLLRTNISYIANRTGAKVFMITSAAPGDGKSWTVANLATAFAQSYQKVLIVDMDFRKGRQNDIFKMKNDDGFSTYLKNICGRKTDENDEYELLSKIKKTHVPNLFLLPSGPNPYNPSELLEITDLAGSIAYLKTRFDIILLDVPPISIVADGLIICREADYTILVAAASKTKKKMIVDAKKAVERVNGRIAGVILNQVPTDKRKDYSKYYSHYTEGIDTKKFDDKKEEF
mgnify:CR=1 FL=1